MSYTPQFRTAVRTDVPLILQMIRDLADYENLLDEVIADEATLEDWLFDRRRAEVIFAMEDLYVMPEYRHQGIGTALFHELARIAVARECGRLEWWCLDWNQAGIDFYKGLGAEAMDEWTVYRLSGDTFQRLAE